MLPLKRTISISITLAAIACGGEATPPTAATNLSGSSAPGVVVNVVLGSHQVAIKQGAYAQLAAIAYDGSGTAVSGKKAAWTSSNAAVVVPSDSGVIYGKAVGTAMIYGTVDGHVDSASVVVGVSAPPATPDSTTHTPSDTATTHTTPGAVASFNLSLNVVAPVTGTDTTNTSALAGVSVALTRITDVHGDSLRPPVLVATLTTDASGNATMANVPGGYYHIVATPPAGYVARSFGIVAPTATTVQMKIILAKAP